MWRIVLLILPLFIMGSSPSGDDDVPFFQLHGDSEEDVDAHDIETVQQEQADVPGYRIEGDEEPTRTTDEDDPLFPFHEEVAEDGEPTPMPDFAIAFVEWEFVPVIEITEVTGAITEIDAYRTLRDDSESIADCFEPVSYPGNGTVNVDVYISYNGIPHSVNGMTDGVRPAQARCVLQRAWRYEFPRLAEDADEGSRVQYQISFTGQRLGMIDRDPDQALLLLERVTSPTEELRESIARGLMRHLDTAERCAATILDEHPTDFVVTEVDMRWRQSEDHYVPASIDILVANKTSPDLPSSAILTCYERTLTEWDLHFESDEELPEELEASFFITVRPAENGGS